MSIAARSTGAQRGSKTASAPLRGSRASVTNLEHRETRFALASKSLLRKVDEHISALHYHDDDGYISDDFSRENDGTLEEEHDLLQFLKLVCPHWSKPRRKGRSDAHRAVKKLMQIGVKDTSLLCRRVADNSINEELQAAGFPKFSKETLDAIRKQGIFQRSLDTLKEPMHFRQTGNFAPVLQMFSKVNLRQKALGRPESPARAAHKVASHAWNPTVAGASRRSPPPDADNRPRAATAASGDANLDSQMRSATLFDNSTYSVGSHTSTDEHRRPVGAASLRYNVQNPRKGLRTADGSRLMTSSSMPCTSMSGSMIMSMQDRPSTGFHVNWSDMSTGDHGLASDSLPFDHSRDRASTELSMGRDDHHDDPGDHDLSQVHRWWAKPSRQDRNPKWTSMRKGNDSLLHHSVAMIAEQDQLEQMQRLRRLMEAEGDGSPMRAFVVESIKVRIEEEAEHDLQSTIDTQQRVMNIRKTMSSMVNARRELSSLRSRMLTVMGDDDHGYHGDGLPPVGARFHHGNSSSDLTA